MKHFKLQNNLCIGLKLSISCPCLNSGILCAQEKQIPFVLGLQGLHKFVVLIQIFLFSLLKIVKKGDYNILAVLRVLTPV